MTRYKESAAVLLALLLSALPSRAAESASASFTNSRSSLDSGGARKTSTSYRSDASAGAVSAPSAVSASYAVRDGFMAMAFAPSRITDLWASSTALTTAIYLQWTAPGNNGDEDTTPGTFLIKYSSIAARSPAASNANYDAADFVPVAAPVPGRRGTRHTLTVTGLSPDTTYYFAIKAGERDAVRGLLSAGATAQTLAPAGCALSRSVHQVNGPFTTISAAVASLPAALTGPACVVVLDGATYPEQVAVRNFTNNGSSITIFADPASGQRPVVAPPALSTAAFLLANASVTIRGLDVVVAQSVPFGVSASSGHVTLSNVGVSGAGIYAAGVQLSSWSAVSDGTIAVGNAAALRLFSPEGRATVVRSTLTAGAGAASYGLHVLGSSSNTVVDSYIAGSTGALVSGSTGTVFGGTAIVATGAGAPALALTGGSSGVTIATSALTAAASGRGLAFEAGGTGVVSVGSVTIRGAARGLELSAQGAGFALAVDSVTFRGLAAGATAAHFTGGVFVATITLANFEDAGSAVNVSGAALGAGSRITMRASRGPRRGTPYENDPSSRVDWPDLLEPSSPVLWFTALSSAGVQYGTVGADGYVVTATTSSDFGGTALSSSTAGQLARLAVSGLDPNTTYYFRAGALWAGSTVYSQTVVSTATLAKPVAGTAVVMHLSSATLSWLPLPDAPPGASSDSASGYAVEASTRADFSPVWTASSTAGPSLSTLSVTGLMGGVTYYFRVASLNWNGAPNYAAAVSGAAGFQSGRVPLAPFGVALSSTIASATLSWFPVERLDDGSPFANAYAATSAELSGYRVYRSTSLLQGVWTLEAALSSSTLQYTDPAGGAQHFYVVRSVNAAGLSARSVLRSVGTLSAFAVAPDDRSYLEIPTNGIAPVEGVNGAAMSAYLFEAAARPQDLGGRVVKSVEFTAKQGGGAAITNFELPLMGRLKLRYEVGASSVIASGAPLAVPASPANLGVYWYNGSAWVRLYGTLDQLDQTMNLQTKYAGLYQLRVVERAADFTFDASGVSNRFVTPNGDGRNDTVVFTYENPRDASVRARILDLRGRVVAADLPAGPVTNSRVWDGRSAGRSVPGGIYLYQLEADGRVFSGTVVILK